MPKMHGLQFLKAVRQDSALDKTGFIMLSGAANEAVVDKADELGVNSFILKPFFPEDLKRRIETLFRELTGSDIDWRAAA
jgi:two-component system chemotaxis response regulator CheY